MKSKNQKYFRVPYGSNDENDDDANFVSYCLVKVLGVIEKMFVEDKNNEKTSHEKGLCELQNASK